MALAITMAAPSQEAPQPEFSSFSSSPGGMLAFYRLLEEKGAQVERLGEPLGQLSEDTDLLIIWGPQGFTEDDALDFEYWVTEFGGTALIFPGYSLHLMDGLPRVIVEDDGSTVATAAVPSPATAGTGEFRTGRKAYLESESPVPGVDYFVDERGRPVVTKMYWGEGTVYVFADPYWLTNGRLPEGENLNLALALADPQPGKKIVFDEYHHGYRVVRRWWQILRLPLRYAAFQGFIALLILYFYKGSRFGTPIPLSDPNARESSEFVISLANLFRRARARSAVLEGLHRGMMRHLSNYLGVPPETPPDRLAALWQVRTGENGADLRDLLETCARWNGRRDLPERELLRLARRIETYRRRMRRHD